MPHVAMNFIDFNHTNYSRDLSENLNRLGNSKQGYFAGDCYYLCDYESCKTLLTSDQFVRRTPKGDLYDVGEQSYDTSFSEILDDWMVFLDSPRHSYFREPFQQYFAPKSINTLQQQIDDIVKEQLNVVDSHSCDDLVSLIAYPIPVDVICLVVGVDLNNRARFKALSTLITYALSDASAESLGKPNLKLPEIYQLLEEIERNTDVVPGSLLDIMKNQTQFSSKEILHNILFFLWAGHETTKYWLSNVLFYLADDPDRYENLRKNPERVEGFCEEVLRLEAPIQKLSRWNNAELTIAGHKVPAYTQVVALVGAANRDPRVFRDAADFDMSRNNSKVLSFGKGGHFCLGSHLARLEVYCITRQILLRYKKFKLVKSEWLDSTAFRAPRTVFVEFTKDV